MCIAEHLTTTINVLTLVAVSIASYAAWKQATAARQQAEAATAAIAATNKQIALAEQQTKAAIDQIVLGRRQVEEGLRPLIIFSDYAINSPGASVGHTQVTNEGLGPAMDVTWYYGAKRDNLKGDPLQPTILAARQNIDFLCDEQRLRNEGITILYSSLTGKNFATEVKRQSGRLFNTYLQDI